MAADIAARAKQAAKELGIDGSYWFQAGKGRRIELWTPYARYTWPVEAAAEETSAAKPKAARTRRAG